MPVPRLSSAFRRLAIAPLALAIWALVPIGCVRMDVLPKAQGAVEVPWSAPRAVDKLPVPHQKDPTKSYRIGPRDVLRVEVPNDPTISQTYDVTEEGKILVPHINPVDVSGKTAEEVQQQLNTLLTEYYKQPDVKVGIQEYRSKVVYVVGQVLTPGPQIMRADMLTLAEAVYAAGLPTPDAALSRVQVITPDYERPVTRQIDLTDIIYKGRMRENILLKPGDIVYVPARTSINLLAAMREITRPAGEYYDFRYRMNISKTNFSSNSGNTSNTKNNAVIIPTPTTQTGTSAGSAANQTSFFGY